ncbi:transporter substrate-binding domain-containing protein [Pseudomonas gingeri]|uniref:Transporter substrate-binding domain-containing protein n=1 Tax=Pseudomonas gingeri TaxID=117681 RepID=A0A7Y7YG19_9PSED|nr:transporter substrate-binding domain-containing protein [Pseudomonas gingeri]NWB31299.1 transporter substrate-binding domain-containing protein [Pseudomonas gingeri]NWC35837.1 transporter substrate-binding domain-containing protein [Pseudomonas gingeri]NWD06284.1 transporter substrate-binding domain-containing protein [Pseudomonas gingeri]NWD49327.1 transporter substrate-binding domain-containing protein [Pseudomonas gingeri]NWE32878.1 transporter substrate-binding domain-containing protein
MKIRRVLLALAITPCLVGAVIAQPVPESLTIATEGAYPPWNYTNADGTLGGYEIELVSKLCERMKVKCKVISQEWSGIIPGLSVGKYDAIVASMGVTEERKKVVGFSKPYAKAPNGFLTASDNSLKDLPSAGSSFDLTRSPKDAQAAIELLKTRLDGKVIGVQTGSTAATFVGQYLKGQDVREYPTFEQLGLELASGRIDLAVANVTAFKAAVDANPDGHLVATGPTFAGGVLGLGTINIALRPTDSALREAFDTAITSVNEDGTNKALTEKWFGVDISIHE